MPDGVFADVLEPGELDELMAAGRRRRYGANVTLFHEGDDAGPVMVLMSGRVKAVALDSGGHEAIVAVRGPGDLLGELSALDGAPRSVTVTTLEPVEAVVLAGSAFTAFLERRPRVALVILRMLAGRLRYADARHADLATHDVVGRVASRLVELTERYGVETAGRIEVELPLSQEEIASWVGASREAVSKALHVLRSLGIVETGRRRIAVLDMEALRRHAG